MNYEELREIVLTIEWEEIKDNPLLVSIACISELTYWEDPDERFFDVADHEKNLNEIGIKIDPYDSWFDLQDQLIEKINKKYFKDLNCKFQ